MTVYHKHHILPKHAGGTDDPSNLVKLTVEEHAEAHRILFEQYGRWQDEVAYKCLSKMIGKEEAIRMIQSFASKGKKQSLEHIEKRKMLGEKNPMYGKTGELNPNYKNRGENSPLYGKKQPKEWNIKKSNALKGRTFEDLHGKEKADYLKNNRKPHTEETKKKLRKPKPVVVCRIFDKKEMCMGNYANWAKKFK